MVVELLYVGWQERQEEKQRLHDELQAEREHLRKELQAEKEKLRLFSLQAESLAWLTWPSGAPSRGAG